MPAATWTETIPRLPAPERAYFWSHWIPRQEPAIFEGMFCGQPLTELRSRSAVRERLGSMQLQFKGEYVEHFLDQVYGRVSDPKLGRMLSFAEYCDHVDAHPETAGWMGQEKVPEALAELFQIPECCSPIPGKTDENLLVHTFIGHPGKSASLHIDTDYKQVLVYEIYGHKRVYLIPSRSCLPLRTAGFVSRLDFKRMTEAERVALVTRLGGWCGTLQPGDTLFLPFSLYHHFEYLDDAMSVNLRFGRNRYHDVFNRYMVPHWGLHALAALLATEEQVEGPGRALYAKMLRCFEGKAPSAFARYQRIAAELERLCLESGAVVDDPLVQTELEQAYYRVPELATAFIPRFRIDFQKCYWHRQNEDLGAWHVSPDMGMRESRRAEKRRLQPTDFACDHALSLFALCTDLSEIDARLLDPSYGPVAMWLRAEFDLVTTEPMRLRVIRSATGEPLTVMSLFKQMLAQEALNPQSAGSNFDLDESMVAALIVVFGCRYDGRYAGSELVRFLGCLSLADSG